MGSVMGAMGLFGLWDVGKKGGKLVSRCQVSVTPILRGFFITNIFNGLEQ